MRTATASPLAAAARDARSRLRTAAPELADSFDANLERAAEVISRRLLGAFARENPAGAAMIDEGALGPVSVCRHGFGRIEVHDLAGAGADPAVLLDRLVGDDAGRAGVARELLDATVNLALAYARAPSSVAYARSPSAGAYLFRVPPDADEHAAALERLATEGHNLHPCARTRLGWSTEEVLAYDLEAVRVPVGFVAVRRDLHLGDDVGRLVLDALPGAPDPRRYAVVPVHGWQRDRIRRGRHADLVAAGALLPLDAELTASTTAAIRTVLLPNERNGVRYLKLALDIQITSTRRSISVASTHNGPILSRLVARLLTEAPGGERVLVLGEPASCAVLAPAGRGTPPDFSERDFSAIARSGLSGRLGDGREIAVPGAALYAASPGTGAPVLAEIVDRFAAARGLRDRAAAALGFIGEYATMLLPPLLWLATRHGIGLEAHLQNCVPTFVDGVPHRLALRDMAGLRVHPPRLSGAADLWPGSVVVTDDVEVLRAKVAYTALQAHLGELVVRLVYSHGLDEPAAWRAVRTVVDELYDGLRADPIAADRARADHAFLTADVVPHKALLEMRLAAYRGWAGDRHVPVENPLR
ncbi:MAG TPA: IucA/IucC family protein [Micromonosporaceae bacterium]|nr:IucA/IucC family protein [Micromonosporaceae bacterium]